MNTTITNYSLEWRRFSSRELKSAVGIGQETFAFSLRGGHLSASEPAHGPGSRHAFGIVDVMAFALMRHLRDAGYSTDQAGQVCKWLQAKRFRQFKRDFDKGGRFLVAIGEYVPFNGLLTQDELADRQNVDLATLHAMRRQVAVVDLHAIHLSIEQAIAKLDRHPAEESDEQPINWIPRPVDLVDDTPEASEPSLAGWFSPVIVGATLPKAA